MKGWKIVKPSEIKEQDILEIEENSGLSKVKITKALITLGDVLRYTGDIESKDVVLGGTGIGIVSDTDANLFGLEKGKHVYIEPYKNCEDCFECKSGQTSNCSNLLYAGEDFDGFLSDFVSVDPSKLYVLPDSVQDLDALFIEQVSLAISVVDKLNIQAGDYVSIVGANNFANILAQLLIYYQAVPIVVTNNEEDYKIAKDSGIYYVLGAEDNWAKEVSSITSGRMTKSVVYVSDCNVSTTKAFSLAAHGASIAFTGVSYKNSAIPFAQAIKKQLIIHCISSGVGNTAASINLLANKAINLSHLKLDSATYSSVAEVFENMSKTLEKEDKIYETIIDLV